jgi:predicted nucleotidyltransferase
LAYLNTLISSIGPQYSVVPFGSVAVGADGNTSDLDLAIRDATHPRGFDDPKLFLEKTAPYEMRRLARRLETEMVNVEPIPWAKVPVGESRGGFAEASGSETRTLNSSLLLILSQVQGSKVGN